ncbi:MAG: O-antigen ligase family protein, partial [Herbinix sp.]|nr:O-antigen ligase family protein [Herbinix sp.]
MTKQKKIKKQKSENELILPIYFILAVLPFITRMLLYDCGLSGYTWCSQNGIVTDFFTYYKSYIFGLTAIIAGILLAIMVLLYRESIKNMRIFIPAGVYLVCVVLSTIFSVDRHISTIGAMAHFENVLVLFGYVILCVYAYQTVKLQDDFKKIQKVFLVSILLMCVVGLLQMLGQDPMTLRWIQKIIIPAKYQQEYIGALKSDTVTNAVSLTLFNANFAAVYLVMVLAFFLPEIVSLISEKTQPKTDKSRFMKKVGALLFLGILFVLIVKTYSRTALVALLVLLLLFGWFYRYQLKKLWLPLIIGLAVMVGVFVGVDSMSQFRFLTKISSSVTNLFRSENSYSLDSILTNQSDVVIQYNGDTLHLAFADAETEQSSLCFYQEDGSNITNLYNAETSTLDLQPFQDMTFTVANDGTDSCIVVIIEDITWRFCYQMGQGYVYRNDFGKTDQLTKIETFGFKNHEDFASGRGYIWSRSLPLIKQSLFIGTGPDTFLLMFPQNDYVGKANNCKNAYTILEKPHNLYLGIAIQTGVVSLVAFLCFFILYLRNSVTSYRKLDVTNYMDRVGLGCLFATIVYLVCGCFIDSSLQTS